MIDKQLTNRDAKRDLGAELLQSVREMKAGKMAQPKTARSMNKPKPASATTVEGKIAKALAQASVQAKKQLASKGLKLPTQSWTGSAVRNPAV